MPRRAREVALVVLVVVNVILLCTLLAHVVRLPQASAQSAVEAAVGGNRFLAVSGQIETGGTSVLFVLDTSQQRLYAWAPNRFGDKPEPDPAGHARHAGGLRQATRASRPAAEPPVGWTVPTSRSKTIAKVQDRKRGQP